MRGAWARAPTGGNTRDDARRRRSARKKRTLRMELKHSLDGTSRRVEFSDEESSTRRVSRLRPRARARGPSVYASTTAMASISTSAPRGKPFASIVARAGEFSGNRFP